MPPKRKKRRVPNWGPILWLAALANTGCGLMYSKVTSPMVVRVEGAKVEDQGRIEDAVQLLANKPAVTGPKSSVSEEVYRRPDVSNCIVQTNLLRRGLVKVTYDDVVAYFTDLPKLGLTVSGRIVPFTGTQSEKIRLKVYAGALQPIAALASGWKTTAVADVCMRAKGANIPNLTIEISENGFVKINSGNVASIALGSPEKLEEKFSKLEQLRASSPSMLQGGNEVVLVDPTNPTLRKMGTEQ